MSWSFFVFPGIVDFSKGNNPTNTVRNLRDESWNFDIFPGNSVFYKFLHGGSLVRNLSPIGESTPASFNILGIGQMNGKR
ncbi:hypothetical protein AM506_05055 [Rossellomorea vietnamensis]|uniref:Uncharacterized protein n=1 Tax=Rossellomorea vietnamensis TaxID=218284 RepID=A0A0P6WS96_9BACI|nr:hypothetical protein AM506_05055 [Rossellomorea vietnamensis]